MKKISGARVVVTGRAVLLAITAYGQYLLSAQTPAVEGHSGTTRVRVPFVGCKSDGQVGPLKPPNGRSKAVSISAEAANKLAYYKAREGFGVLAPRGWYCFGTYGSNGSSVYVSPQPISTSDFFSGKWGGLTSSGVQLSFNYGDTSGRFEVARIIARVFPAYRHLVSEVIKEGIEPPSSFPFGPYPSDKLTYKGKNIVEFETPGNADGLGTNSWLKKNSTPINGSISLVYNDGLMPGALSLSLRLSPNLSSLGPTIIQQTEWAARHPKY